MSARKPDTSSMQGRAKVFGFIPLKAGWSRDEWLAHYQERHGPLVAATSAFARHFRSYAQNYAVEVLAPPRIEGLPIIGVSELWFDEASDLMAAFAEPVYQSHIQPDEEIFTEASRLRGGVGREHVLFDSERAEDGKQWARQPRYKLFVTHPAGTDEAAVNWLDRSHDMASRLWPEVRRYAVTIPDPELPPFAEGVVAIEEFWFDSIEDGLAGWDQLCAIRGGSGGAEPLLVRHQKVFAP